MTDTFQWERCLADGTGCVDIGGATGSTYAEGAGDVGKRLRVRGYRDLVLIGESALTDIIAATGGGGGPLGTALPTRMPQSSGAGGTFYVDPVGGNDSNPGTLGSPWRTINKAISTVPLSGSIIMVKPGTYTSVGFTTIPINFNRAGDVTDPITIQAVTPGTVTILLGTSGGQTYGAWLRGCGLRVKDITFKGVNVAGSSIHSTAIAIEAAHKMEIDGCTINEVGSVATSVRGQGGIGGATAADIWFIDCVFRPSGANPFAQVTGCNWPKGTYYGSRGSHWLYAGQWGSDPADGNWNGTNGSVRLVVANCIFVGSTFGRMIELGPEARNSFIVNNTFYGNHAIQLYGNGNPDYSLNGFATHDGGAVAVQFFANTGNTAYSTGNNIVANNIFVDLDGHAAYGSGPSEAGNVVTRNIAYSLRNGYGWQGRSSVDYEPLYGSSVLFAVGSNATDANPLFTDAGAYDFSLQGGSPAAGVGDPGYAYPFDILGLPRSVTPALGAYEA